MRPSALSFFEHGAGHLGDIADARLLCAFDFDGTLAPIVTQPDHARMPLPMLQRLTELAQHVPIAVITGRSVCDISDRLGFVPDYLVGNHGLEGLPGSRPAARHHAALCERWKAALLSALETGGAGIWVEDKTYSLSVHYRLARDHAQAQAWLRRIFEQAMPEARIVGGKCVFNLLPPGGIDKGTALEALMHASGAKHALYIGDDVTDEDVFRLGRTDILTVRIGRSAESGAAYYVNHRLDLVRLVDDLLLSMRHKQVRRWHTEPGSAAEDASRQRQTIS
jgi:trehalose 6-phosphate phosphatase